MTKDNASPQMEASFYAVAFFDLLGQSERLAEIHDERVFLEHHAKLAALLKDTFGRVLTFRKTLDKLIANLTKEYALPAHLAGRISQQEYAALTSRSIGVEYLGDAALLKVCLKAGYPIPPVSIDAMLQGVSTMFLAFLAGGIPIRGGIDVGWGWEITPGSLYGTMVPRVLRLEEKEAEYPRILVGQVLMNYLRGAASDPTAFGAEVAAQGLAKAAAERSLSRIVEENGKHVLNPFDGTIFVKPVEDWADILENVTAFVSSSIEEFAKVGNEKLRERYERLEKFIVRHAKSPT